MKMLNALPPKRSWCCYEILNAVKESKPILLQAGSAKRDVHLTSSVQQKAHLIQPFQRTTRDAALNMLQLVDLEKAEAQDEKDRLRILDQVKTIGLSKCNAVVKGAITGANSIIFNGTDEDECRPLLQSVITNDTDLIKAANYNNLQLAVAFQVRTSSITFHDYLLIKDLFTDSHDCSNIK